MVLSRDQILAADDIRVESLQIPEWGGDIYIRVISGRERDAFDAAQIDPTTGKSAPRTEDFRARYAVLVACDENGFPIFTSEDVSKLTHRSASALDRILEAGLRLNGQTDEAAKELEKNLIVGQNESSGSD